MHGFLTRHTEVKVGRVFHLIRVSCFLDPVSDRVAVNPVHYVPVVVPTASVMAWTTAW